MGKNKNTDGRQQGATNHAPSQHGSKTTSHIARTSQTSDPLSERTGPRYDPEEIRAHAHDEGKSRLFEDRQQHDEAEETSEQTRLSRDIQRHNH